MIKSPVIIVGCARSGTTLLYNMLAEAPDLWSIGYESKAIIEKYHHPSVKEWESGSLEADDLTAASSLYMLNSFTRQAAPGKFWRRVNMARLRLRRSSAYSALKRRSTTDARGSATSGTTIQTSLNVVRRLGSVYGRRAAMTGRPIRLLEKTPENCLRLPFLQALFPDARLLFLVRDGRANVRSLMEGWQQPHLFPGYHVPASIAIPGQSRGRWAFTLIPGWRELIDRPLAEVCAWQWVRCNEAVLAYLAKASACPVLTVRYEDLVGRPRETLSEIAGFLDLDPSDIPAIGQGLPEVNVVSRPEVDKWRQLDESTRRSIEPILAPTMAQFGYAA